jgi:hypothetical protein
VPSLASDVLVNLLQAHVVGVLSYSWHTLMWWECCPTVGARRPGPQRRVMIQDKGVHMGKQDEQALGGSAMFAVSFGTHMRFGT